MPPDRPRTDSRARAERAFRLRSAARTWGEIAEAEGFKSPSSAANAVTRYLRRQPPEDLASKRLFTAGGYQVVLAALFEALGHARTRKEPHAVVAVSRAIAEVQDKHARLMGLHVAVPQEVTVNVHQTAAAVIDRAQEELLAIAAARPSALPVIDAEIVEEAS